MRKISIIILCFIFTILSYFTFISAEKVFHSDFQQPQTSALNEEQYRLVLITQELETPFWDKVAKGAIQQAQQEGVSLEVWGSYGNNQDDFLKKIELAIHSKMDGIIVQGLDTEEFSSLTKFKAASSGIPIITVANDVPIEESLRKTYVGSDQILAGKMIAKQLIADMGSSGKVIILGESKQEYHQQQRLQGIQDILKDYPNVETLYAETPDTKEQVITTTQDLLNQLPDVDAFIAVNANNAGAMIQEIGRRSRVEPFHIYTFDDGTESFSLLTQGKLDGMLEQSPEKMGELSVNLIMKWLTDEAVPLNMDGYLTDIRIVKATNM
ncbi:sugar ABC transporter substrate-binding protein [Paenisporosarcina antarctica]|uniref:Sugar ABC transporter substrate-binding protein n=1 Tax=Paenisporosarcina antarctica TaxID=417367 RepID=A0A4P6ZVL3_9BACL|nr:substrate-binding domain-containing protein [Paenisporosarcina antarctica]QBP40184.1 sugar ABC transporter substrate-binding protein [Paenisporosarcina antarctica]